MSEPHAEPLHPREGQEASPPPLPPANGVEGGKVIFLLGAEPSDDAPTIISKKAQANGRPEDTFAGTLRGRRLAHFELVEPIGVGGMAAVIRARDSQLDRNVALKILPPDMANDPEVVKRFHQEARAAAKLDHENIARVFFCGEDQGLHFIAFEFVEGENLRAILERRGRLSVAEALQYVLQIATGVAHAATRGVVHRDIKPSNILISPNGRAKLVDMGLARSLEPQVDQGLTQSGVTLGTFDYISPEQAMEPREADVRSDIYSLGCTLYHMLTGKAPVPDGTAAKKLHHHQHVPPIDPRQLNPDIPDDVAAVLGRMMAKDPTDRYQRPEVLVQHLIYLAQKYGELPAAPDSLLFVDTPLPSPPRLHPLLVAGVAALLIVGLVALQGMFPGKGSSRQGLAVASSNHKPQEEQRATTGQPALEGEQPRNEPSRTVAAVLRETFNVDTPAQLAEALQKDLPNTKIVLAAPLLDLTNERDLFTGPGVGLFVEGSRNRQITIAARAGLEKRPKIRLAHIAEIWQKKEGAILTINGCTVIIDGVDFEVDAGQSDISLAAVRVQDGGRLIARDCGFDQNEAGDAGQLSSIVVEASLRDKPSASLVLSACSFLGHRTGDQGKIFYRGHEAITVTDADVTVSDCAFGPHAAIFHLKYLKSGNRQRMTSLKVDGCSVLLADGAVFRADHQVHCSLAVHNSLISHPEGRPPQELAALIQQEQQLTYGYIGDRNCYHNLKPFLLRDTRPVQTWDEFLQELEEGNGSEDSQGPLAENPWSDKDPIALLGRGEPLKAFQPNVNLAELRRREAAGDKLVGMERCALGRAWDNLPALEPITKNWKIVDTEATGVSKPPYYKSLKAALVEPQSGDVICIKQRKDKRPIEVDPVQLVKASVNVIIKPYRNDRPVLTLGINPSTDPAIFEVHDSTVKFQELEFLLRPQRAFHSQQVLSLVGNGSCTFEKCVFTFESEGYADVRLAAAVLADPKKAMKMDPEENADIPKVSFENCLVRGKGNLVTEQAARPARLTMNNSLLALAGSILEVNGNQGDPQDMSRAVQVAMEKSTAILNGHLVVLRTQKNLKDLGPVKFSNVAESLFVAAGGKSLVHFDGDISDEELMKRLLSFEGRDNGYVNFKTMLDHQPVRSNEMPLGGVGVDRWPSKDGERWFGPEKMTGAAMEERDFARFSPEDLNSRLSDPEIRPFGVKWNQLPRPIWNAK